MKRVLSVLLVFALLFGAVPIAYAADAELVPSGLCLEEAADGVKTLISFSDDSSYTAQGTVDFENTEKNPIIERVESFAVSYEDEVILTVTPHDICATGTAEALANGYYAIDFPIPDSTKECFIAGLTPNNAAKTQEQLLEHYITGECFSIEDIEYIDAEKLVSQGDGDDLMCWAAAASNMLKYSGWGSRAGFESEDDIFEALIDAFEDEGGNSDNGIKWFFSGLEKGFTNLKKPETGAYLPEYDVDALLETNGFNCSDSSDGTVISGMKEMIDHLKNGDAVELSVDWIDGDNAHAVTLWGCVADNAYSDNLAAHYDSLIISDSDNNEPAGADRRVAPNTLDLYHLEEAENYGMQTVALDYSGSLGALMSYVALKPYSADIPYEADARATKDRRSDPDFKTREISVQALDSVLDRNSKKGYQGSVYLYADVFNYGARTDADFLPIRLTVRNTAGDVVLEKDIQHPIEEGMNNLNVGFGNLDQLTSGKYTAEIDLNPEGAVKEALLVNNHFSGEFEVIGSRPDTSGVNLSAEVGAFSNGVVPITFDYHDLTQTELYQNSDEVYLAHSRLNGRVWSSYMINGQDPLPDKLYFYGPSSKVRFCLLFKQGDLSIASDSVEYEMAVPVAEYIPKEKGGFNKTFDLESGEHDLGEGNEVSFRLMNSSIDSIQEISGTLQIYCIAGNGSETPLTEPESLVLSKDVPSDPITFSSWSSDIPMYGTNSIQARFVVDGYDGFTIYQQIAMINAKEKRSSVVNINNDVTDPYDMQTSLREAAAYCEETGGTVTFVSGLASLTLKNPIQVNQALSIDGKNFYEDGGDVCVRVSGGDMSSLFRIAESGKLDLKNLILGDAVSPENGGAILCEGGTLITDHVLFEYDKAKLGGGVYLSGGKGRLRNTSFNTCKGNSGAAVYIDQNADAEMLNCTLLNSYISSDGAVYNNSGRLNLINSAIVNCGVLSPDITVLNAVFSKGETNIINTILTDTDLTDSEQTDPVRFCSASGNVRVYCSAVDNVGEGVITDALTRSYAPKQLIPSEKYYSMPKVIRDDAHAIYYPELTAEALNGCVPVVADGKLVISKDGESIPTGISTAFTEDELRCDILGSERVIGVYGPCEKITEQNPLGDANLDGVVDITDATTIQRYDVKMIDLSDEALRLADVDRDGEVCVIDATWIQRHLIGMRSPLDGNSPNNGT